MTKKDLIPIMVSYLKNTFQVKCHDILKSKRNLKVSINRGDFMLCKIKRKKEWSTWELKIQGDGRSESI